MAAPAFVASASLFGFSATAGDNGVDAPLAIPLTASAGDRAFLVVTARLAGEPPVPTTPTGWTAVEVSNVSTASGGRLYIYTTEVGSDAAVDPGDPAALTLSDSTGWTASVTVVSPSDIDDYAMETGGSSSSSDTSAAATASDDALALYVHGTLTTPNGAQITIDADAATTERVQACTNATGGQRNAVQMVATETVIAGAVPTRTVFMTQTGDVTTSSWQQQAATVVLVETVNRPTVDAGSDQTVVINGGFTVTGTVTGDGGGAGAPYTPSWRIVSDSTGGAALNADDELSVTGTVGPDAGTVVLGFKVTDSGSTDSLEDTLTITVTGAADIARPIGDSGTPIADGWVPSTGTTVWQAISDNSDVTYVRSPDNPTDEAIRNPLGPLTAPSGDDPVTIAVRVRRNNASAATVSFALIEGVSTVIAQSTSNAIAAGSSFVEIPLTLSSGQKAAVSNWGDLSSVVTVSASE